MYLGGHFLFTCSDTFDAGGILVPQCTAAQTDGQTGIQHYRANSRSVPSANNNSRLVECHGVGIKYQT